MPKPKTLRNTPVLRFSSMSLMSDSVLVVPTFQSPSVQRITRFVPFGMKFRTATSYAC